MRRAFRRPPIEFQVPGIPVAQGSKSKSRTGHLYERTKGLYAWRNSVASAALLMRQQCGMLRGAVELYASFHFPRPKSVKRAHHCTRPDLDKLTRAVMDAITKSGLWEDDSRVVNSFTDKRYSDTFSGVVVRIRGLE